MSTGTAQPQPPAPDPLVGREIDGKYRVHSFVARGSMGKVYRAEQLPLGRMVALKILDPHETHVAPSDTHEQRFLMEASVLAKLSHPNTVRIYDYGVWEGRTYLVMEYIGGTTLKDALAAGRLEPRRALHVARQIAMSLAEAHQLGVIHRDLKPGNVLLTQIAGEADVVKVVDFGLVKELDGAVEMTGDGTMLGTPMYMAPEQIRGGEVDQRTDLYSLGVVLYKALTGETPFKPGNAASVLTAHVTVPAPPFDAVKPGLGLPPCLEWTVLSCLAKSPSARFASALDLVAALRACEIALADPSQHGLVLRLDGGRCIVPPDLDTSWSSSRRIATAPPPEPTLVVPATEPAAARRFGLLLGIVVLALVGLAMSGAGALYAWVALTPMATPPAPAAPEQAVEAPAPPVTPPPPAPEPPLVAEPARTAEPVPVAAPAAEVATEPPAKRAAPTAMPQPEVPPTAAPAEPHPAPPPEDIRKTDLKDPWAE
jgi:serine/threonine protein kinase